MGNEHLRKQHRSLAELHYSKAVSLFLSLKDAPCELLRTLLEKVAFTEFTMAGECSLTATDVMSAGFGKLKLVSSEHPIVMLGIMFQKVRAAARLK